jgi:penicillin-binding protein 2
VIHQIDFPPEVRDPIINGLTRVITGPGVEYPKGFDHAPTGYYLFRNYPDNGLPLAGKTGTAQGADSKPWYDSSVFAAFSRDPSQPYTVVSYLEKAGYGAKASAPLVKCMANALGGTGGVVMDEPALSDPLDQTSTIPAPVNLLADMSCAINQYDKAAVTRD